MAAFPHPPPPFGQTSPKVTLPQLPPGIFDYVSLGDIVTEINSGGRVNAKVALVLSGGGAAGAYEAGVVEAMLQMGLAPDIIVGTSAGSLVSLALFLDLMYPFKNPDPLYKSGQSKLWKGLATGNNAATTLFGSAWLIDFITGKPSSLSSALQSLSGFVGDVGTFIGNEGPTLRADWKAFTDAATSTSSITQSINDVKNSITAIKEDIARLGVDLDPSTTKRHLYQAWGDFGKLSGDFVVAGVDLWDVLTALFDKILAVINAFEKLVDDVKADIIVDAGAAAVVLAALSTAIGTALLLLESLAPFLGEEAIWGQIDHILDNTGLNDFLGKYMSDAIRRAKTIPANATLSSIVINDWINRPSTGAGARPEVILTTTDLKAARQVLFTVANEETVLGLAQNDRWVVDVTGTVPVPIDSTSTHYNNVFHAQPQTPPITAGEAASEFVGTLGAAESAADPILGGVKTGGSQLPPYGPLVKACITSTSIPFAFKPQFWMMDGWVGDHFHSFGHSHVDGGVVDNTAIDVAAEAGATHIICVQLSSFNSSKSTDDDPNPYPFSRMAAQILSGILVDGPLRNTINAVIGENARSGGKLQIYRLAPMEDEDAISTLDFDGHYKNGLLTMNLYDFFMQGYVDARGGSSDGSTSSDPIYDDYERNGLGLGCAAERIQALKSTPPPQYGVKRFWWARTFPEPQ